jgi:hypothetical protein
MEMMEYEGYESEALDMAQDISFSSVESTKSNILSEISVARYGEELDSENSEEFRSEPEIFEESEIFEEFESPKQEFPNEAYRDLMLLVTDHKLSNKAGNAIIRFFNKYSALPKSPLPKNIERGREFMNKMNFPNLTFNKIRIALHNGKEYFLHYQNLINCIKNILAVPNITQNFALSSENYLV